MFKFVCDLCGREPLFVKGGKCPECGGEVVKVFDTEEMAEKANWLIKLFWVMMLFFFIALFSATCITILRTEANLNRLTEKAEASYEAVHQDPVWLRLKKAGFKDYRIDPKNRQVVINY